MADSEARSGRNGAVSELAKIWPVVIAVFMCGATYMRLMSVESELQRHVAIPMHAEAHREITLLKARYDALEKSGGDLAADIREIQRSQALIVRRLDALCVAMGPQCKLE